MLLLNISLLQHRKMRGEGLETEVNYTYISTAYADFICVLPMLCA